MEVKDNMLGVITGIQSKKPLVYRVLLYTYNGRVTGFKAQPVSEEKLIQTLGTKNLYLTNAEVIVEDGKPKLVGKTGGFERFNKVDKVGKTPLVIVAEIRSDRNKILGYKVANRDCNIRSISWQDLDRHCKEVINNGGIPIQNAMYVQEKDGVKSHLRSYPNGEFIVEVYVRNKSEHAQTVRVSEKKNEELLRKIEEFFTPEQAAEIKKGMDNKKVNVKVYANKKFSPDQMKVLRESMEEGVNAKVFAHPAFSVGSMRILKADLKYGADVRYYLNPKYSPEQLMELGNGVISGIDITKYANPTIPAQEMSEIRLRLENNFWTDYKVERTGDWN